MPVFPLNWLVPFELESCLQVVPTDSLAGVAVKYGVDVSSL